MAKNTPHMRRYPNAVSFRNTNRLVVVEYRQGKGEYEGKEVNAIQFKALTSEVGPEHGVSHGLSKNGKIKYSELRLSDDALVELYISIGAYLKNIKKAF